MIRQGRIRVSEVPRVVGPVAGVNAEKVVGLGNHFLHRAVFAVDRAVRRTAGARGPTEGCGETRKVPIDSHEPRAAIGGGKEKGAAVAFAECDRHRTLPLI